MHPEPFTTPFPQSLPLFLDLRRPQPLPRPSPRQVAAEAGLAEAQYHAAGMRLRGLCGVARSEKAALALLELAAEQVGAAGPTIFFAKE